MQRIIAWFGFIKANFIEAYKMRFIGKIVRIVFPGQRDPEPEGTGLG